MTQYISKPDVTLIEILREIAETATQFKEGNEIYKGTILRQIMLLYSKCNRFYSSQYEKRDLPYEACVITSDLKLHIVHVSKDGLVHTKNAISINLDHQTRL